MRVETASGAEYEFNDERTKVRRLWAGEPVSGDWLHRWHDVWQPVERPCVGKHMGFFVSEPGAHVSIVTTEVVRIFA